MGGAGGGTGAAVWNFNGTAWTEVATLDGQLTAVSGSSANDVYVVGEGDLVEQWNGTSFNVVSATGTAGFTGVATLSNGTAIAVGGNGIETNATTAAPAVSVATPASSVSAPFQTTLSHRPPWPRPLRRPSRPAVIRASFQTALSYRPPWPRPTPW